jgi:hypothetical protein
MTQGFAHRLAPLLGCLLAACSAQTNSQENTMGLDPATAAYQQYGYNDHPVEARLGPHRYLIPANYFRDQIGPDFQGNFSLLVQWPDLQPLPPGERSKQDMEAFAKQITIVPHYVDRVPLETRLEASLHHPWANENDPTVALELRDRMPGVFDLTPYRVNGDRFLAYQQQQEKLLGIPSGAKLEDTRDWYIARDADGRPTTVIKCDSQLRPDGYIIQGEQLLPDGDWTSGCDHMIVIPEDKLRISIGYRRVFLKDWKKIEQRARDLFAQYRAR